ncbi:MAG: phage portal protein [Anaerovoracaceae bacterium]
MIKIGLLEKIFPKKSVDLATGNYFQTLTAYRPRFRTFTGGIYEALMVRASIHTFANHCSKLNIEATSNDKGLKSILAIRPNPWQTSSQFLYRIATILENDTTAFIVPITDFEGRKIEGFYPVKAQDVVIKEYQNKEFVEFTFPGGKKRAIESNRVGILTKYQYKDDMFGEGNATLRSTIQLIDTQDQGIIEGVKTSAAIRFMAMMSGTYKDKDIIAAKKRFEQTNLENNNSGVMVFDEKFKEVKQINSTPILVDDKQMQQIKNNVYTYFGTNEGILMNKFNEEEWNAYYEGKIEPFAIQLSEVLTNMIYSTRELAHDNRILVSANRLEHASHATKVSIVTQLFDRGMMTQNQGLEIFNMKKVEDGDKFYIRREYAEVGKLEEPLNNNENEGGNDNAD